MAIRKLCSDIFSSESVVVGSIYLLLVFTYHLVANTLKKFVINDFALHIQSVVFAIHAVFVLARMTHFYQPWYVFLVFGIHVCLLYCGMGISTKLKKRRKDKRYLIMSAYLLAMFVLIGLVRNMICYFRG